jgi:Apolipoprotein A1/A4/E domain
MATSNKAQDPAAAALSAIEEALNLGEGAAEQSKDSETSGSFFPKPLDPDKKASKRPSDVPAGEGGGAESEPSALRLPEVDDHPLFAPKRPGKAAESGTGAERLTTPSVPPANDDRDSVGAMLRALNRKPSQAPFALAALFSGIWIVLAAAYFIARRAEFSAHGSLFGRPDFPLYALAVIGPVIFFVITALLARRAQEMRLTARSMVEIAMRLAEPESIAAEQMVTLSQAIRREIVSMGDGIERALARAGELETLVRSEVSNLERSYSDNERRIRILVDELVSEREAIQTNGERMRSAIGGAHDAFSNELETASTGLSENLSATGNRITMSLGAKAEEIRFALNQAGDQLVDSLAVQAEDVIARLEQAKDSVEATVGQTSDHLVESLTAQAEDMIARLEQAKDSVEATVGRASDQLVESLSVQAEDIVGRLERAKESVELTVGNASDDIAQALLHRFGEVAAQSEKINERLAATAQDSLDAFTYHAATLGDRFTETVNDAINAIATHSERVGGSLADRLRDFEQAMIGGADAIAARLGDDAQQLSGLFAKQLESLEGVISVQGSELDHKLESRARQMADVFVAQTQSFEDRASAKLRELAESLDMLIQRVDSGLDGRAKSLNESLAARTLDIAKVLGEGGREVAHALETRANEIDEILSNRAMSITEALSAKADEVNAVLGGRAAEIAETLDERIATFEERVVNRLDSVSAHLDARGRDLSTNITTRAREIDESLARHTSNIGVALDKESGELARLLAGRAEALKTLLAQASSDIDSTLAGRIGEIGGVLAARVSEIGTTLASRLSELQIALDERNRNLNESLRARSDEIHAVLETKGTDLVGHLSEKQAELTAALAQSAVDFKDALASTGGASVQALVDTNEKLKQEMTATIGALVDRNAALQEMIANADASFKLIETGLTARIQQFDQAVTGITKEIEDLGANAGTTIGSARALYETIAHQQQALAGAAADLSRSQVELDRTLDERRAALGTLLNSVQAQRDDFDQMMSSFSAIVDESFRRVENRAQEIGSFLADTSQATAGMVERQFGDIRSSLGTERERTAALLHAAYEEANAEIEGILGQSTARFEVAANEMRGISREIQHELEATREELRRSAVVLPQETAEQTAAMRRIVADQIKALNELTDIVARSGHSYDLSDPLTFGAGRSDGALVRRLEAARPEREPALAEAPRSEPPRPLRPLSNGPRPANASDRGPTWLSDLLARASREETPPPKPLPRASQQSEPLEAISHDIARMVDQAAIGEAWDNYRRGEANAFSRQLYIGRGPQTFEEIRRRYRNDIEFRDTVDRYVQEFERLLADVSRDDRDDSLTRTYLTSETGKVYTMLAHAAGRLGG